MHFKHVYVLMHKLLYNNIRIYNITHLPTTIICAIVQVTSANIILVNQL